MTSTLQIEQYFIHIALVVYLTPFPNKLKMYNQSFHSSGGTKLNKFSSVKTWHISQSQINKYVMNGVNIVSLKSDDRLNNSFTLVPSLLKMIEQLIFWTIGNGDWCSLITLIAHFLFLSGYSKKSYSNNKYFYYLMYIMLSINIHAIGKNLGFEFLSNYFY